ncbi:MAG: hypothetical protein LBN93_07330 [Candidatus Symbiothrix sp.]|jgi:hypothetical protein|nr:hypothetical protein [Candidatus Symbiothrix sp.]
MKTFNFRRLRIQSAMTLALAIACILVTGNCSPVTAQVAIGGDGTVTPGALLDLSQATDAGGLLLPQIESADTATAVLKKPGMLVTTKRMEKFMPTTVLSGVPEVAREAPVAEAEAVSLIPHPRPKLAAVL